MVCKTILLLVVCALAHYVKPTDESVGVALVESLESENTGNSIPSAPTGLNLTLENRRLSISWEPQDDASYYIVTSGTKSWPVAGDLNSFQMSAIAEPWKEHLVLVMACRYNDDCSDNANATLRVPPSAPSTPRNFVAFVNKSEVILQWDLPKELNGPLDGYQLKAKTPRYDRYSGRYFYDEDERSLVIPATRTKYTLTDFLANRHYTFTIRAFNILEKENLTSDAIQASLTTPPKAPLPSRLWVSSVTRTSANINWESPYYSSADRYVAGYIINLSGPDINETSYSSGNTFNLNNLKPGTTYHLEIKSYLLYYNDFFKKNENITSNEPARMNFGTKHPELRNLTLKVVGPSQMILSWDSESLRPLYRVKVSISSPHFGSKEIYNTLSDELYITELSSWTEYTVSSYVCYQTDCIEDKQFSVSTPPEDLMKPAIISISSPDTNSFEMSWKTECEDYQYYYRNRYSYPHCRGKFLFRIRYCNSTCHYTITNNTEQRKIVIDNLEANTTYHVQLRLKINLNNVGYFGPPTTASVRTWNKIPEQLTYLSAVSKSYPLITLSWSIVNSSVDCYQIHWENSTQNISETSLTVRVSDNWCYYDISVKACNTFGCGLSRSVNIRPRIAAPSEPTNVTAFRSEDNKISISWDPPVFKRGPLNEYRIFLNSSELVIDAFLPGNARNYTFNFDPSTACTVGVEALNFDRNITFVSPSKTVFLQSQILKS